MERSNEYDNQTMQNEEPIIRINDETKVDQIMEERENPSLQTKISRISKVCEETNEETHFETIANSKKKNWCPHNRNSLC